jgi:hypothetical protein
MLHFSHRQIDEFLKWVATAITLAGAVLTSLAVDPLNVYLLNTGSFVFLIWAVRIRDGAMIAVNAGLLAIYGLGTVRAVLTNLGLLQ